MWSKNQLKFVRSLRQKKGRDEASAFVAEGHKVVSELADAFHCRLAIATADYVAAHEPIRGIEPEVVSARELEQASSLTTPHGLLAVFDKPQSSVADALSPTLSPQNGLSLAEDGLTLADDGLVLALDGVQDPGNVGTILRIADWFGISRVVCSQDTADAFSPKVVQATMGALARVKVSYAELVPLLSSLPADCPVYGTFMDGENLYEVPLSPRGVIVMGNEGNGISSAVEQVVTHRLHIPSYPTGRPTVESLNVAMATAITVAEFRRRSSLNN